MKVRLLLAHSAEVQSNLLYAMGIGWTRIGPGPSPFAIAALIEVLWDETNRPYRVAFDIVDVDGQPFQVPTPTGDRPFHITAEFRQGRPPDAAPGTAFLAAIAVNVQPVQFQPGRQYLVRALVDDTVMDQTGFRVRIEPPPPPQRG
jgi:hypothetical protein